MENTGKRRGRPPKFPAASADVDEIAWPRRGRPPSKAEAAPPIEHIISGAQMEASLDVSRATLLQLARTDPDFPRLFTVAGRLTALLREWNNYILKLPARGYQGRDVIGERIEAKRARLAAAANSPRAREVAMPVVDGPGGGIGVATQQADITKHRTRPRKHPGTATVAE